MRLLLTTAARVVLGSYLAVHGAQKLYGSFGGHGPEATGQAFERIGLRPGGQMARLAGTAELGGGVLTATGIAHPLGPTAIAGTMAVASATHRQGGPLAADGGYELPLTNMAFATMVAALPPSGIRLGPALPRSLARLGVLGTAAIAGVILARLVQATAPEGADGDATTPANEAGATTGGDE